MVSFKHAENCKLTVRGLEDFLADLLATLACTSRLELFLEPRKISNFLLWLH